MPSTLSSDPLQTTNCPWLWPRQELAQLLAGGVDVDPLDVEPRRHDRADPLVADAEHALHQALFVSSSAPLSAPWLITARISSSVRCGSTWPLMPKTRSTRLVDAGEQGHERPADARQRTCIGMATHEAMVSGWLQADALGDELADDERQEGDDRDDEAEREASA